MTDAIIWWSAIIAGNRRTIKELVANGSNPFQALNGQTAEEAVLSFSRKLFRVTPDEDVVGRRRLQRYSEIISILQAASIEWHSKAVLKRFLCRWLRAYRRTRRLHP